MSEASNLLLVAFRSLGGVTLRHLGHAFRARTEGAARAAVATAALTTGGLGGLLLLLAYNTARQLTETSREEVYDGDTCITPETITEYTRDAVGRVLTTTRRVGPMATTESSEYDALGRVTKQTDVLGRITTTAYSEDGLTTSVTSPAGATSITARNTDGSTASVGGTAQRAQVYVYDLNGSNERVTTKLADGTTIAQASPMASGRQSCRLRLPPRALSTPAASLTPRGSW